MTTTHFSRARIVSLALAVIAGFALASQAWSQGVALRAVSPINEGIAGCATACPIDATGALHWNPASIAGLPASDMSFGVGLIIPTTSLESTAHYTAPAALTRSGRNDSESGAIPGPNFAMVVQDDCSPWTYGFGMYTIGGANVNYSASSLSPAPEWGGALAPDNPVLGPQDMAGIGRLSAQVEIFQMAPTVAYNVTERLAIGASPTITLGRMIAEPLFLGPGEQIGANPLNVYYPPGTGTRFVWGGGFQLGVYYNGCNNLHYGFSLKSPQWVEPFRYKAQDQNGAPITVKYDLDYPLILSWGVSYDGIEDHILACDIRWFNYAGTPGFDDSGYDPVDRHVLGLGWRNCMSVSLGAQRRWNDVLTTRMGYCFNTNPIPDEKTMYNIASPLVTMHTLHLGASVTFRENWVATIAYAHAFENSITGSLYKPIGGEFELPGSSVTATTAADTVAFGVSKRF